jgi:hypothetical protein
MFGYIFAGVLMTLAAAVEWTIGIDAERKSLESVAIPLASGHAPEPGS